MTMGAAGIVKCEGKLVLIFPVFIILLYFLDTKKVLMRDQCRSNERPMGVSKESISKFWIGNRFHVKFCILCPEICKQSLRLKSRTAKVRGEKSNKLKTKMNKAEHQLRNMNILNWTDWRQEHKLRRIKAETNFCKQATMGATDHSRHSERSAKTEYKRTWTVHIVCLSVQQSVGVGQKPFYLSYSQTSADEAFVRSAMSWLFWKVRCSSPEIWRNLRNGKVKSRFWLFLELRTTFGNWELPHSFPDHLHSF